MNKIPTVIDHNQTLVIFLSLTLEKQIFQRTKKTYMITKQSRSWCIVFRGDRPRFVWSSAKVVPLKNYVDIQLLKLFWEFASSSIISYFYKFFECFQLRLVFGHAKLLCIYWKLGCLFRRFSPEKWKIANGKAESRLKLSFKPVKIRSDVYPTHITSKSRFLFFYRSSGRRRVMGLTQ